MFVLVEAIKDQKNYSYTCKYFDQNYPEKIKKAKLDQDEIIIYFLKDMMIVSDNMNNPEVEKLYWDAQTAKKTYKLDKVGQGSSQKLRYLYGLHNTLITETLDKAIILTKKLSGIIQ